MGLTEFLLARIAEDEAAARERHADAPIHTVGCYYYDSNISPEVWTAQYCDCAPVDKARALAECEAKRGVIEAAWADYLRMEGEWGMGRGKAALSAANDYPDVLRFLAIPYADHRDYQPEWRP